MARITKKQQKQIDRRVEQAYYATCSGIQIDMMDISKVFAVGRECVRDGVNEETLRATIRRFVESIRKN